MLHNNFATKVHRDYKSATLHLQLVIGEKIGFLESKPQINPKQLSIFFFLIIVYFLFIYF